MIKLITAQDFPHYTAPKSRQAAFVYQYMQPFMQLGSRRLISNLQTQTMLLEVDGILLPVTKNETQYQNSYVTSLFTHYIAYAKEEINIVKLKWGKGLLFLLLKILGRISKAAKINQVIIVNNFMLSTNLYYPLSKKQYQNILAFLTRRFPHHLIMFRSLNEDYNKKEIDILTSLHCQKLMSRRVYLLKKENIKSIHKKNLRKDQKLIEKNHYRFTKASEADVADVKYFYDSLYLEKYSKLNPQFTEIFYKNIIKYNLFDIYMLKQATLSKGVCGLFSAGGGITAPIFGYSPAAPREEGLYRVLSLWGIDLINRGSHLKINFSSGVSDFKRCRGAAGATEYSLIFYRHLPLYRKIFWKGFCCFINHLVLPMMIWKKY